MVSFLLDRAAGPMPLRALAVHAIASARRRQGRRAHAIASARSPCHCERSQGQTPFLSLVSVCRLLCVLPNVDIKFKCARTMPDIPQRAKNGGVQPRREDKALYSLYLFYFRQLVHLRALAMRQPGGFGTFD